jgi:urate oxidase
VPVRIVHDSYGKSRVRLIKVAREGEHHDIQDLSLNIALEGDFDDIHRTGDNTNCLPTDTMKNTVYALAGEVPGIEEAEDFGRRLARHFLDTNDQVERVRLEIAENSWKRMKVADNLHDHSFVRGSREKRVINIAGSRDGTEIESGVEDLIVLKTTKSGFAGFKKDKFTTLPEVTDRIFATAIKALWKYADADSGSAGLCGSIREIILKVFAEHDSLSVQHTLYAMGEAVLEQFSEVAEIAFSLPNVHCLPVDITRFGMEDKYAIFVPTDEPHGLIEARLAR